MLLLLYFWWLWPLFITTFAQITQHLSCGDKWWLEKKPLSKNSHPSLYSVQRDICYATRIPAFIHTYILVSSLRLETFCPLCGNITLNGSMIEARPERKKERKNEEQGNSYIHNITIICLSHVWTFLHVMWKCPCFVCESMCILLCVQRMCVWQDRAHLCLIYAGREGDSDWEACHH